MKLLPDDKRADAQALIREAFRHLGRGTTPDAVLLLDHHSLLVSASMLLDLLKLSGELTIGEREGIVRTTLTSMYRAGKSALSEFEARVKERQADLLKPPKKHFHMLAALSARRSQPKAVGTLFQAKVAGVVVRIVRTFPSKANTTRWMLGGYGPVTLQPQGPFVPLWATVNARTEAQAGEQAMAAIKAVIGSLNFVANYGSRTISTGRRQPLNRFQLLREQVLYRADWSRYEGVIYYEENHYEDRTPPPIDASFTAKHRAILRVLERLNDRVVGPLLIEAMQDYQEALSYTDPAFVHARLWSLLERLTDSQAEQGRVTVKRASFLSAEFELRRRKLAHAAAARHAFVHNRKRSPFIYDLSEDLRGWAEELLAYLCFERRKVDDVRMFFELLNAPRNKNEIERQIRVLRLAKAVLR